MEEFFFLLFILTIGFTHGLEPSHGWPIALLYSAEKEDKYRNALISSSLISIAHFISSITAVIIYIIINEFLVFETSILSFIAFGLLIVMALLSLKDFISKTGDLHIDHGHNEKIEDNHNHPHFHEDFGEHTHFHKHFRNKPLSLKGIVLFAFILGFAHEEEFALLGIALVGINPYLLMIFYGFGVLSALVGITLLSLKFYEKVKKRINDIDKYLPLINFVSFLILAILILVDLFL